MNIYNTFVPDQFCVYHTTYSGKLMPKNYIGSTSVDKILNKNYHGSVSSKRYKSIWLSELKLHPELFNTDIISYHDTRSNSLWKELSVQKIFNVVENPLFINRSYASLNGFFGIAILPEEQASITQKRKDTLSKKTPEQIALTNLKISNSLKGNVPYNVGLSPSDETRLKMSNSHTGVDKGPTSEETKLKQSIANKGIKQPKIECPHCKLIGGYSLMKRWHGDNCKLFNNTKIVSLLNSNDVGELVNNLVCIVADDKNITLIT